MAAFQAKRIVGVVDGLEVLSRIEFRMPGTIRLESQETLKNCPLNKRIGTGQ